jgi:hypothetical protein
MTLPRRFTRPIVVDDIRYRWMLKETDYGAMFELLLVVEAADNPNGVQLTAHIQWRDRTKEDAVTPATVAALVRHARACGWDSQRPGSRVDCNDRFLELVRARQKPVALA